MITIVEPKSGRSPSEPPLSHYYGRLLARQPDYWERVESEGATLAVARLEGTRDPLLRDEAAAEMMRASPEDDEPTHKRPAQPAESAVKTAQSQREPRSRSSRPPAPNAAPPFFPVTTPRADSVETEYKALMALGGHLPHFAKLLEMSGLRDLSCCSATVDWEVWLGREPVALVNRTTPVVVAILHSSNATVERLRALADGVEKNAPPFARVVRLLGPRVLTKTYDVEQRATPALPRRTLDVWPFSTLLETIRRRLISRNASRPGREPFFVDPHLRGGVEALDVSALQSLLRFLSGAHDSAGAGVLLGSGGLGKSTILEELATRAAEQGQLVLFVSQYEWSALERRKAHLSVESLLKETLHNHGFAHDDLSQIDILLANGALALIFDSFDEVCSRGPGSSPEELLRRVLAITRISNSRARVLVAARPEFWAQVDEDVQASFEAFWLQPFRNAHIDAYIEKRFHSQKRAGGRARELIARLESASLAAIPLVLHHICNAVEDPSAPDGRWTDKTVSAIRGANPILGVARLICERETLKHDLAIDAAAQLHLLTTMIADYGSSFRPEDVAMAAQVTCGLTPDESLPLARHALLSEFGEGMLRFANIEVEQAIVADRLFAELRAIGRGIEPGAVVSTCVERLMSRVGTDYPSLVSRVGRLVSGEPLPHVWARRAFLSPGARGVLFRILIEAQPRSAGYRALGFLPIQSGRLVASDFLCAAALVDIDLIGVRFLNVQFRHAELSRCIFSELTRFDECTLRDTSIGKECSGLTANAFLKSELDTEPRARSSQWMQFDDFGADERAQAAFRSVLTRVLAQHDTKRDVSVFSELSSFETELEEIALGVLRLKAIVSGTGGRIQLSESRLREVRKYVSQGELSDPLREALKKLHSKVPITGTTHN